MPFSLGCCLQGRRVSPDSNALPARPVSQSSIRSPQTASVPSTALPSVDYGTPLDKGIRRIMSNPRVAPVDFSTTTHELDFESFVREDPSFDGEPPTNEELEELILNAERAMQKRYQQQSAEYKPQSAGPATKIRDFAFANRKIEDASFASSLEAAHLTRRTNMSAEAAHLMATDHKFRKKYTLPFRPKVDNNLIDNSLTKVDNSIVKVDNSLTKVDNSVNEEILLPNFTYSRGNAKRADSEEGAYDRKSGTGLDWGLGGPERRTGL